MAKSNFYVGQTDAQLRKSASDSQPVLTEAGFIASYKAGYLAGYADALAGKPAQLS